MMPKAVKGRAESDESSVRKDHVILCHQRRLCFHMLPRQPSRSSIIMSHSGILQNLPYHSSSDCNPSLLTFQIDQSRCAQRYPAIRG